MKYLFLLLLMGIVLAFPGYAEVYKWVDEKGTAHFADNLSKVPKKYRPDVKMQNPSKEGSVIPAPATQEI